MNTAQTVLLLIAGWCGIVMAAAIILFLGIATIRVITGGQS